MVTTAYDGAAQNGHQRDRQNRQEVPAQADRSNDGAAALIKEKTTARLQQIIRSSPALVGLTAIDLTDGEVFSWNEDIVFPQASAIKIPILMEVFRQAEAGQFSLDDELTVKPENTVGGTGIIGTLAPPVSMSVRNLCILMITQSDNTATNTLIDLVGMERVNAMLADIGLADTRLRRKMMDPAASARGDENTSTPAEAAAILKRLFDGSRPVNGARSGNDIRSGKGSENPEAAKAMIGILKKNPREHSRLAAGIPGEVRLAFKPGELDGVSTEWALVLLEERPYAVAVMESYKIAGQAGNTMERLSGVLYNYFWRKGHATRYGTYADPGHH